MVETPYSANQPLGDEMNVVQIRYDLVGSNTTCSFFKHPCCFLVAKQLKKLHMSVRQLVRTDQLAISALNFSNNVKKTHVYTHDHTFLHICLHMFRHMLTHVYTLVYICLHLSLNQCLQTFTCILTLLFKNAHTHVDTQFIF